MPFQHAALSAEEAGPEVWKVVRPEAPAPLRGMVARGLAPLRPRDLVVALYCFWAVGDEANGELSARTAESLPANILTGALEDRSLPPGVLDFLSRKHARNEAVLERVVRHPNVHDETLAGMARLCPESICDMLAENQTRWLKFPPIVEALYQNPNCRMSVAQRMLELAVREGIDVKLPNMEEIRAALQLEDEPTGEERDELFKGAAGRVLEAHEQVVDRMQRSGADEELDLSAPVDGEEDELSGLDAILTAAAGDDMSLPLGEEGEQPPEEEEAAEAVEMEGELAPDKIDRVTLISRLRPMEKIRMALLGNAFERMVLIRDSNKSVCLSAIKSPRVKENEVVAYSANRSLPYEVVRYIATRRDWTKLYAIKLNLVLNPKTPMSQAMGFLGHLHHHDVRKVSRSKNIPSALATAAKRRAEQRR